MLAWSRDAHHLLWSGLCPDNGPGGVCHYIVFPINFSRLATNHPTGTTFQCPGRKGRYFVVGFLLLFFLSLLLPSFVPSVRLRPPVLTEEALSIIMFHLLEIDNELDDEYDRCVRSQAVKKRARVGGHVSG